MTGNEFCYIGGRYKQVALYVGTTDYLTVCKLFSTPLSSVCSVNDF